MSRHWPRRNGNSSVASSIVSQWSGSAGMVATGPISEGERNGTVVQCVRHKDIAFHAGPANDWTIGIEHNTRTGKDKKLTAVQYLKSAELVLWLCNKFGLAPTRYNISGHSEAAPATPHPGCPGRVLKWDLYMAAISDLQEIAQGRTPMRLWNDDEI